MVLSVFDLGSTWWALRLGGAELSLTGAIGLPGMVGVKAVVVGLVLVLAGRHRIARAVGWGLAVLTGGAVLNNLVWVSR